MKHLLRFSVFFLLSLLASSCLFAQTELKEIWEPQVAGRFYPGNTDALKDQINSFFKNVPKQANIGRPLAIIAPHAGYQYSGQVAAFGYSAVKDHGLTRVIIISPRHAMGVGGVKRYRGISVLTAGNFKTPLGTIPIDRDACNHLINSSKLFGPYEDAYKGEHSLETQLPFLQMALGNFTVVPIMVGLLMDDDYNQVSNAIRPLMDDKTLVVVSSDFTHYGEAYGYVPFKNDKNIEKNIRSLDYGAFEKILSKDFDGLKLYKKETGLNACGIIPVALLLKLLPEDATGEILNYNTSGHQSSNFSYSVSYASILFSKPLNSKSGYYVPDEKILHDKVSFYLTNEEKFLLLSLARNTLETYITKGVPPSLVSGEQTFIPRLREKYGVFVTLKKHGKLRGCIGHIIPRVSLFEGVIENTINSSSHDWRFSPVEALEIPDITIEISVLSQMRKIESPEEFAVGRQGILIRKGPANAVFLPQVAVEQGWDKDETLCQLCKKAGLSPSAWKDIDMEFYVFTADVFQEGEKS